MTGQTFTRFDRMKRRVRDLVGISTWPYMTELIERAVHKDCQSIWEYPFAACEAIGAEAEAALPGAAAIFCSLASIHLVDDMLDEDPYGDYRKIGAGNAANFALAFQAAAHRLLRDSSVDAETRDDLQTRLADMSLATAIGQSLDMQPVSDEEGYWRVVGAKTPPLFGTAFYIGARLGGASPALAEQLHQLGGLMGSFIQVSDDLGDAMESPAKADWQRPANNLALLFALTTEHPDRERFRQLALHIQDGAALAAAQEILVRCGALSYCTMKLVEMSSRAHELLARIPLADPAPIKSLLSAQARPVERLLQRVDFQFQETIRTG